MALLDYLAVHELGREHKNRGSRASLKSYSCRNASLPRRLENNGSDYAKQQVLTYDHCGLEYQQVCQCLGNQQALFLQYIFLSSFQWLAVFVTEVCIFLLLEATKIHITCTRFNHLVSRIALVLVGVKCWMQSVFYTPLKSAVNSLRFRLTAWVFKST